ncbi:MAG: galactokinase family protein [Bacillota bacterium]
MGNTISKEQMKQAYPRYEKNQAFYDGRIDEVVTGFEKTFGDAENVRFFSAPGRIEIGGNHTDHQHGSVLAASIDLDIVGTARKTETSTVRILSEGYPMLTLDISDLTILEEEKNTTNSLIRGIYAQFKELKYETSGMDVFCISNVLKGSGLSSSAAFEVFIGTVMNHLFCDGAISSVKIAQIGQYAENVYFGKPSGLMDQMASSVGNIVAIDFNDNDNPIIEKVDFDFATANHSICIIDSGADHADLTDEYTAIPVEMKGVAKLLGKSVLREVDKADVVKNVGLIREKLGDRALLRAFHFFGDHEKAVLEAKCLKENDFAQFLEVVKKSGDSSYMYLQNVYVSGAIQNQEVAVGLCMCQELLGERGAYRVHGGGFAGTLQAFVPNDLLDEFKTAMEKVMGEGSCHVLSIRSVGGVELKKA